MKIDRALVKGSVTLLIAFGIFNVINFIFQASMSRMLSLAEFGILSVLYQIIYLASGAAESLQISMVKFATNEKDKGKIKNLLKRAIAKLGRVGLIAYLAYLFLAILISHITGISYFFVAFTGLIVFVIFLTTISRGILQGKKRFNSLGLNMIIESVLKTIVAISAVWAGWSIFGALFGTLIGIILSFLISFVSLRDILGSKESQADSKIIRLYGKSYFVVILSVLLFYTCDIFLVKIFFSPEIAGAYAVISILSKAIFFGTSPIGKAMFPVSAETASKKSRDVVINSFILVAGISIVALLIFIAAPDFVIHLFSGKSIEMKQNLLFYNGLAVTIIALSNILLLYKLSLGKVRKSFSFLIFTLADIAALGLFLLLFGTSLFNFIWGYIFAAIIFFIGSMKIIR